MQTTDDMHYDDIDPVLFILNEKNTYITTDYIEDLLKKYDVDHKVQNLPMFQQAMIHISYLVRDETNVKNSKIKHNSDMEPIDDPTKAIPLQTVSYERLEFLGDSVLHLVLAEYLFKRYEGEDEGFMTRLRTKIESGETLALISHAIGLNKYVLISRYIERNVGRDNNTHILEDSFEAFMGALYLEAGFHPCKKFMINLMEQEMDFAQILNTETNFKDKLLQYFHQQRWQDPHYGTLDISGPEYKKSFTIYVKRKLTKTEDGEIIGMGIGVSKKRGEQEAAKNALIHLKIINDDESDSESLEEYISSETEEEMESASSSESPVTKKKVTKRS
jgi:dsRNA-specific ribonuclease